MLSIIKLFSLVIRFTACRMIITEKSHKWYEEVKWVYQLPEVQQRTSPGIKLRIYKLLTVKVHEHRLGQVDYLR